MLKALYKICKIKTLIINQVNIVFYKSFYLIYLIFVRFDFSFYFDINIINKIKKYFILMIILMMYLLLYFYIY